MTPRNKRDFGGFPGDLCAFGASKEIEELVRELRLYLLSCV